MKKKIIALSMIMVLGMGTICGPKAVQSIKNTIEFKNNNHIARQTESVTDEADHLAERNNNRQYISETSLLQKEIKIWKKQKQTYEENDSVQVLSNYANALDIINPDIDIEASNAILLNCDTGKVLYHKNATVPIYPASTTKLITVLVALDLCDLTEEVTIGKEVGFIASDSSRAYLKEGQKLTMQMLLEGALIPSGNDAAYAIASYCGKKLLEDEGAEPEEAVKAFVEAMNQKVSQLGLIKTQFKNPDGYDEEGQYTTAYDLGIIAMEAMNHITVRIIAGKTSARNVFLSGEDITWNTSNKLIETGSKLYYQYAIGLKTGTSSKAGKCLVSAAEKDGIRYISVIMNSTSGGRWKDSVDLLSFGIGN